VRGKKPAVGDVVTAPVGLDDRLVTGTVDWIGAMMFAIQNDTERQIVMFANTWEVVDEAV
jgi:hypothetical protein